LRELAMSLTTSLFHEPWWLSAVTGGRYDEVVLKHGSNLIGRLPFIVRRRGPFLISEMPPYTHLLGPAVDAAVGKPQTQIERRLSIVRAFIDQLPVCSLFEQKFDPSIAEGSAIADGLAFQQCCFELSPEFTYKIECNGNIEEVENMMHFKVRQHIRH